ncbi:cation:proton antiporter [Hansschlegelia beijingensis]|uniref:cation:proton antiporter n=1 Tax=Hansschlegelia beijingensis TaxID=1133344 RepID=UPI00387EFDFD
MFTLFELSALLLTLCALFGWLNHKYLPLPHAVGLLVMSVAASALMVAADVAFPDRHLFESLTGTLRQIDFSKVVMDGMLAFLLFAGALHVDLGKLRSRAIPVALLAFAGTVISTAVVGFATWWAARIIGLAIPLPWAFVFGALISPTDPVAVMSTLRNVAVPADLEVELQGESLFNDGIGIVLFTVLLRFAIGSSADETSATAIIELLVIEAGGGILLGLVTGYVAYWGMKQIDDYPVEVLISLALVTCTYAVAQRLHVSGPLSMVAAGLLIGDRGPRYAMSDRTQTYLFGLWTLIDEILNSVLFLLIGLEVLVLSFAWGSLALAFAAIPIVLIGRLIAVSVPLFLFSWSATMSLRNVPFLTWAGVRGGISVALALSIPEGQAPSAILSATYGVVSFSIVVQGLTLGWLAKRTIALDEATT